MPRKKLPVWRAREFVSVEKFPCRRADLRHAPGAGRFELALSEALIQYLSCTKASAPGVRWKGRPDQVTAMMEALPCARRAVDAPGSLIYFAPRRTRRCGLVLLAQNRATVGAGDLGYPSPPCLSARASHALGNGLRGEMLSGIPESGS